MLPNEDLTQSSSAKLKYKIQITQPEIPDSPVQLFEFKNQQVIDENLELLKDQNYRNSLMKKELISK